MKYDFPKITHIDDVLPYIKDAPEFIVAQKDGYQVVNYVVATSDTFPPIYNMLTLHGAVDPVSNMLRRECRGLVFDLEGNLINRRYHKFFNVNEREETLLHEIDWSKPHVILEKLDGSMISPCCIRNHIRWMTKMGVTDTSMAAEVFVANNPQYALLARDYLMNGYTPIFEWCSNKNRIVLDYPEDRLVLTAVRATRVGMYFSHDELVRIGERYGVDVVKAWSALAKESTDVMMDFIRQSEDSEGVVVRFNNGHMVKIKSDWYVRIHKVKSLLENEREVVGLVLRNELDDLFPVLPPQDVVKVKAFANALEVVLEDTAADIAQAIVQSHDVYKSKKTFALVRAAAYPPLTRSMIFRHFDAPPDAPVVYMELVDLILKNSLTNTAYRKVKEEFLKEIDYE